ncbi:hypothetical protein PHYPSEUDO_011296 [Phytophthora pseudosyringae]|uniref:dolichol kinase n=1 Tax=Phytophthora pseudosyringae TaxID=221518 RepID=A0A8T1WJC6_9STRA|nr:hypothetical protein PHYPSEUDO_011296 [Phytophthora pseudosyringae]
MTRKATSERRRAQVAEATVLMVTGAWVTYLVQEAPQQLAQAPDLFCVGGVCQTDGLATVLLVLHILGFSAVLWSIFRPQALSKTLRASSRQERDAGLVVGCVLPPLVLLSRLLAEIYQEETFSSFTFFYAWTSISIGVSVLLKVAVFGTVTSFSVNALVDVVLLPVTFGLLSPVEAEWRFLLATGGRIAAAAVLAAGFRLLPRSFTVGEALLVAQGISLCAYDLLLVTVNRLSEYDVIALPPSILHPWIIFDVNRADYILALEVGMLGSLLVCVALIPLLRSYGAPSPATVAQPVPLKGSVGFVLTAAVVVGGMVYPWSCFLLETWNPFAWLVDFLVESSSFVSTPLPPRFALMGYWATCLVVLVPLFGFISSRFALPTIVARKLFHLLVVLMLGPASLFDAPMLSLSYGVALSVFFLVECVRALALPPFGKTIAEFMRSFIDYREAGRVILTHSYLLLGCALPLWLAPSSNTPLVMNAGVLALGIGDAMGAVVGSSIGKHRIFGSKTVEGSVAVFVSMLLASIPLQNYQTRSFINGEHTQLILLTVGVFLTSVLEAATAQIDNLVLPLFFYTACNLLAATSCANSVGQIMAIEAMKLELDTVQLGESRIAEGLHGLDLKRQYIIFELCQRFAPACVGTANSCTLDEPCSRHADPQGKRLGEPVGQDGYVCACLGVLRS